MTGDRPTGAELLALAHEHFQREIAPHLPPEKRLDALMILNAMGIAERELTLAEAGDHEIARRLRDLYGIGDRDAQLKRLGAEIRAGAFDARPERDVAHDLLWALAKRKARAANPKLLSVQGLD
jgi:hypothetical protein